MEESNETSTASLSAPVVGVLHPGVMGTAVAAILIQSSSQGSDHIKEVIVATHDRSETTKQRVLASNARDVGILENLCRQADVILSIVPPSAAEEVAHQCLSNEFRGIYCDMNAVSSMTTRKIGRIMAEAGVLYVDGAILGPPPLLCDASTSTSPNENEDNKPLIALSGKEADKIEAIFRSTNQVRVKVIGERIGQASSMKIAHAAYKKGMSALLLNIAAFATAENIGDVLAQEWEITQPQVMIDLSRAVQTVPPKAWRFEGEMSQICDAFSYHDLPGGFSEAAGQIFHKLKVFKDNSPGDVKIGELVQLLLGFESLKVDNSHGSVDTPVGAPSSSKPKVLCLHGWRTSGSIMRYQCRDFPHDVEYVFADSCHPASGPPHTVISTFFEPPYYQWWDTGEENDYQGLDATLDYIRELEKTQGPFLGVAGFSQGAGLAAALCAYAQNDSANAPIPNLKFCILCSPFVPKDPKLLRLFQKPVTLPAFISFGETDYIRSRCEECIKYFPSATVKIHNGGHEPPTKWKGKEIMQSLQTFIQDVIDAQWQCI